MKLRLSKIKLRHPALIPWVALLVGFVLRLWLGTLRYRYVFDDPSVMPRALKLADRKAVYVFWHEMMLLPAYTHARDRVAMLVSDHADGELVAQVVRMLGGRSVRGSTSRRAMSALRGMMRKGRASHLAITPDGPRGPRRVVQPGAVYVASRTGMLVVPAGFAYSECWRHRSWDRMAFPFPGRLGQVVIGRAIEVPANLDREGIEEYRRRVQAALDDVQARAERLAGEARASALTPGGEGLLARITI